MRICTLFESGKSQKDISVVMGIKPSTIQHIIKHYEANGRIYKKKRGPRTGSKITEEMCGAIQNWLADDCGLTLVQLKNRLSASYGIDVSKSTVDRAIKGFNYSFKRTSVVPERRNCESTITKRKQYADQFLNLLQGQVSEEKFIFIDEVGFNVSMRTGYGRSLVGTPAVMRVPHIKSKNISICCAINKNEVISYTSQRFAFNTSSFGSFLEQLFIDLQERNICEGVLIMDNVSFHHARAIKAIVDRYPSFTILFLPPYSPFLNPIENMFSKWKNIVKRGNPTDEAMMTDLIETGRNLISQRDCESYFRNIIPYLTRSSNSEIIED